MREMKCGVCGEISEFEDAIDFSKLEECDLGGQPNLSDGETYENMVQCCKICGYCNFDISKNVLSANKVLQTENYQYILNSQDMDKPVANMSAVAYIYEFENNYLVSAKAHSYASKMCELKGDEGKMLFFKEQEVRLLLMHVSSDEFKKNFDIKVYQYIIDALRRLKKFDKAIKFCDVALTKQCSAVQKNIFLLEKSLCVNFISQPHKFTQSNGEFGNFYQILIQGFSGIQNQDVYKKTYLNMRSYLEKSVYFPIAEGADFIMQVGDTNLAGMDDMITQLRETYDKVRGGKSEKPAEIQVEEIKELTKEEKEAKILTIAGLEEEKQAVQRVAELEVATAELEKAKGQLESQLAVLSSEKETLLCEANILYDQAEKSKEELSLLQEKADKLEKENATLSNELSETVQSRRELTAEYDNNMYAKESENRELLDEIAILNELLNETEIKKETVQIEEEITAQESEIESVNEIFQEDTYNIEENQEVAITQSEETGEEKEPEFEEDNDFEEEIEETKENEELEKVLEEEIEEEIEEDFSQNEELAEENSEENEEIGEEDEDMAEFVLDELTEDMILSIAQISGQIDVSEVQGMLLVGYKNAKYALDKIAGDGKLQEDSEDVYKYIEV